MADCHRQSYDKDPELGICGIIVQRYTWTSIEKAKKKEKEDDSFLGSTIYCEINYLLTCKTTLKTSLKEICIHNGEL